MKNDNKTHQFCKSLLILGSHRNTAMANYVISLASSPIIQSPVDLSSSEFNHYHYSNLTKVLEHWELSDTEFQKSISPYISKPRVSEKGIGYCVRPKPKT